MVEIEEEEEAPEMADESDEWKNLMGADLQMKVIKQDDDVTSQSIEAGDAVIVDFVGYRCKDRDDASVADKEVFHRAKDWLITVGDKELTPALEMGIRFMELGEHAIVYSASKFAYGPWIRKNKDYELPPNSNVAYQVHVKSVISDDAKFADPHFQIEIARSKKQMGNDVYENEWSDGENKNKAILLYKKAADIMTNVLSNQDLDDSLQKEALELQIDCLNNTAAVRLKAKDYGRAKEAATQVLMRDADNVKALCRAARACCMDPVSSLEEAEAAIQAAEQVDASNADVKRLRVELAKRKQEYKKMSKAMFAPKKTNDEDQASTTDEATNVDAKKNTPTGSQTGGQPKVMTNNAPGSKDHNKRKATDAPKPEQPTEQWWRKYVPHLFQMVIFYILLTIFNLLKKRVEASQKDNSGGENSEF